MFGRRSIVWISASVALGSSVGPEPLCGAASASRWVSGHAAAGARNPAHSASPAKPARSSQRSSPRALPESVLVRIDGSRDISRSFAIRRWREQHPTASDDSITPAAVHEFLDLLTDGAVLTEAAVREAAPWSPEDSAAHQVLRDRLVLAAALDSVLAASGAQAASGATLDADALGTLARERIVARLAPEYQDSALARVARAFAALPRPAADSTLAAQLRVLAELPHFTAADSNVVLAHSTVGDVRLGDVVAAWSRLSLAYRPRIDTAEQVRDLVRNQLFQRVLRTAARDPRFERDPRVAAALTEDAAQIWRRDYLERKVLAGIVVDSASVVAYWSVHARDWTLPLRVRGIRLVLDDRAAATRMAVTLADAAAAESLATRAARRGVDYRFVVGAANDSALFRMALAAGPGVVLGPAYRDGAWWVARVGELLPGRGRSLAEVRDEIVRRCYAEQAERSTRALATRLRAALRITIDPAAASRLATALREGPRDSTVADPH